MSRESFVSVILMSLIAGLLADKIRRRNGLGVFGDVIFALIGALIATLSSQWLNTHLDADIAIRILVAAAAAIFFLLFARLILLKNEKRS